MAKNYKDLGKDAKDLLSVDFLSGGGFSIVGSGNLPNKINLKANFKRAVKDNKESYEVSLEPKYEFKQQNIEASGKISLNDITGTLIAKDVATKGARVELGVDSKKDLLGLRFIPGFKNDNLSIQSTVNYPVRAAKQDINASNELVVQFKKNYFFGLKVDSVLDPKNLAKASHKIDAALHLTLPSTFQFSGRVGTSTKDQSLAWGLAFFQKYSDALKWALDYSADSKGSALGLAGEWKHTNEATFKSKVTVRSNGDFRKGLALKYLASPHVTFVAGLDLNLRDLIGTVNNAEKHSWGLEIKYNH